VPSVSQEVIFSNNEDVSKITESLSPEFYKERYSEKDLMHKIVDNRGDKFENLYGTRNVRVILHGIAYRGGGNNYYHRTDKRKNQNPLPDDGLINLCQEGFSNSVYLYQKNFDSTTYTKIISNCVNGKQNKMAYSQLDYFDKDHIYEMLKMVYESAKDDNIGPVYLHCWNGWHASGYLSAIILKQFCGYTNIQATTYWDIATDGANHSPRYRSIRKDIEDFIPYPEFKLEDEVGNKICPPMPEKIDESQIHLEIEHLLIVPEAIPLNYSLILYEVHFNPGKTTFANIENNIDVQNLLEALNKYSDLKVEIGGHTDRSGNESKNKILSKKRAKFVYDYLIRNGVASSQITYKGFGSSRPAFSNKYKSGRKANRRIEVKIIKKRDYGSTGLVNEDAYKKKSYALISEINKGEVKEGNKYILSNLTFEPNRTNITDSLNKDLLLLVKYLENNPGVEIEVGGHTDNSGIKEKNDSLSNERALAVFLYLIKNGINEENLDYVGYGSQFPIEDNRQRWGRDKNRRIEIKVLRKR